MVVKMEKVTPGEWFCFRRDYMDLWMGIMGLGGGFHVCVHRRRMF